MTTENFGTDNFCDTSIDEVEISQIKHNRTPGYQYYINTHEMS